MLNRSRCGRCQAGATLMETLISLALSAVVVTAMVVLMANSMGTATRITQASQLTDELRNVMSMMTRDVRRANFTSTGLFCYGNAACGTQDLTRQLGSGNAVGDLVVGDSAGADDCVVFQLDRLGADYDGDATNDSKGGFRRVEIGGVGVIQMWVSGTAGAPACNDAVDAAGWLAVTDPNIADITVFAVDDSQSLQRTVTQAGGASSFNLRLRQLALAVEGELLVEQGYGWTQDTTPLMIQRRVEDTIRVRNDFLWE